MCFHTLYDEKTLTELEPPTFGGQIRSSVRGSVRAPLFVMKHQKKAKEHIG